MFFFTFFEINYVHQIVACLLKCWISSYDIRRVFNFWITVRSLFFLFYIERRVPYLKKNDLRKYQNIHTRYIQNKHTSFYKVFYKQIIPIQIICIQTVKDSWCKIKYGIHVTEMVCTGRHIIITLETTRRT